MNTSNIVKPLLIISSSLFLLIVSPSLFSDGMFLDGLMYAGIANNLAEGQGTFWNLFYTKTLYPEFHEHPPLVFGIQAIFFKLFGSGLLVERIYSLFVFFLLVLVSLRIWKLWFGNYNQAWLIVLFYATIPLITWSTANNMLENTMSVFTLSAAYCYFYFQKNNKFLYLFFASFFIFLAFLSKGFTALFVWTLPLFSIFIEKRENWKKVLLNQLLIVGITLLFFAILFALDHEAFPSLQKYFYRQVVGSIENVQTVKSRFYIVGKVFTELLIPVGIILLFFLFAKRKGFRFDGAKFPLILWLFAVGFSGVFPIMISMKQSGFYLLCALPFFVLGLNVLAKPIHDFLLEKQVAFKTSFKLLNSIAISFVLLSLIVALFSTFRTGRDKDKIVMVHAVLSNVKNDETIQIPSHLWSDWNLHAYFCRFSNVSLLSSSDKNGTYYLTDEKLEYEEVVHSGRFFLYKLQ